ncbi:MAG: hypothetical protein A2958_02765 [Candidatus Levybacteria bacterium RIFCSPLOWO2_01_FULL_38_13]|nr:MAG: hypothetical protein A2629_03180 [Candidatus Levybacteria bacterium RIFCSPHIGHO2_01_FULL_41_15]OGH35259.1 MAG: hypothetical protein A2958_02765 [Candidatus Levybacteria bacterium RIFCSPLOWO2_01_FULL_38_13]
MSYKKKEKERGQTLLIVVLIMVVSTTIGLSLVSKSIVSLRTSTEEAESAKALTAAEAGVQQALQQGTSIPSGSFANNTSFNATVSQESGISLILNGGNPALKDEGINVWLVSHSSPTSPNWSETWEGDLTFYWGETSDPCNEADLEIYALGGDPPFNFSNMKASRNAVHGGCSSRENNFLTGVASAKNIGGKTFHFSYPVNIKDGLIVRVVPLYKDAVIAVEGSPSLPSQGILVSSEGQVTGSDIKRKINIFQPYPSLPNEFFLYGLLVPKN